MKVEVVAPDILIFCDYQLESISHIDALFGEKAVHRFSIPVDLLEHNYKISGPFLKQHLLDRVMSGPRGDYRPMMVSERP